MSNPEAQAPCAVNHAAALISFPGYANRLNVPLSKSQKRRAPSIRFLLDQCFPALDERPQALEPLLASVNGKIKRNRVDFAI